MKKLLTIMLFLGVCVITSVAQTFTVVEIKGTIDSLDNRGRVKSEIVLKEELDPSVRIRINENSYVRLVDQKERTMYFFKNQGEGTIEKLIADEQCTITKLAESYLKYLLTKMAHMPDLCKNKSYMARHCHTTRGDTLITDTIVSDTIVSESFKNGYVHRDTVIKDSVISDTIVREKVAGDTIVATSEERLPVHSESN